MIKGFDASTLSQNELYGGKYYDKSQSKDCLLILKESGVNLIRLRLFVDPYDEEGHSYGAGICDLDDVIKMAKRAQQLNLDWYLDLHYSDCWADPGKQILPKSWANLNLEELTNKINLYTSSVLQVLSKENILPKIVSIGNEITNGFCWPLGHKDNFANLTKLINAALSACADYQIKTMLHLDKGSDNNLYRSWFDNYFVNGGEQFDYIGLSYYPVWHGRIEDLENNIIDIQNRYHKQTIIAETSYPFTMDDYSQYEQLSNDKRKGMASKKELMSNATYPISVDGQKQFLNKMFEVCLKTGCLGLCYWGGECIPVVGVGWASDKAIEYMHEKGPGGNEWANQALFDYEGRKLDSLDTFLKY